MIAFKNSFIIFLQFMRRDFFTKRNQLVDNFFNYALIYPIVFAIQSAYFQGHANFTEPSPMLNTILFAGNILVVTLLFTYKQNIDLLFDLEGKKYIEYQITMLSPFLVILERIIFTGLYTFLVILPYYPMGKLILGSYVTMNNTNWPQLIALLFAGSMCLSAYHLLAAVVLKRTADIGALWSRVNGALLALGGFWAPLWAIQKYSPLLGKLVLLNPCLYLTEGAKGAITGSTAYLPFWLCMSALLTFTGLFTALCWWQFKRRVDCL
jgi:ABC-2 type transport system permease protein